MADLPLNRDPALAIEQAISALRDIVARAPGVLTFFDAESFIKHELAPALEAARWTPVTDRLPDDDLTVMVALTGDEPVWFGFHDEHGWHSADASPLGDQVTHWMPMPEGPK